VCRHFCNECLGVVCRHFCNECLGVVCRHLRNECLGVVAVTLLRIQEISGLSFAVESVCLTDFLWFYWAPADKVLDIT